MFLVAFAFVASLLLAPYALAQEEEMESPQEEASESLQEEVQEELMEPQPEPPFAEEQGILPKLPEVKGKQKAMPKTGGVEVGSFALVASVMLVASGIVAYTVARRR